VFNREKLIALLQLTSLLGGMGKRVRRGMGSWQIEALSGANLPLPNSIQDIYNVVKKLSSHYILQNEVILMNFSGRMDKYPWVRKIEIGKSYSDVDQLLMKISKATHDTKGSGSEYTYNVSLGHAKAGRLASPIYVSVLPDKRPIVTTLNTIPDRDTQLINPRLQDQFKNSFL
jgi:CRISPR-associated protein Cmr1